jgi:hypothetical protein
LLIELSAHPTAIQERLGHSDIAVRLNVYGHLFLSLQEALTERLDEVYERAVAAPGHRHPPANVFEIVRRGDWYLDLS